MMTTNLFAIANVKQLRTYVVLEFYCLFPNILVCWHPKLSNFFLTVFTIGLSLARFFVGPSEFRGGVWKPQTPPRYATVCGRRLNVLEYVQYRPFFLIAFSSLVVFALGSSFNTITVANIAGQVRRTENDREIASDTVYREVLQSF